MKRLVIATLVVATCAATSAAAVIQVRPKLVAVLKPDFTPVEATAVAGLDPLNSVRLRPSSEKYILQFDFLMTIESLTEGQVGFGNTAFHINLTGANQSADWPGWLPDQLPVDMPGPVPGIIYKWAGNTDAGQDGSDLKYILLEVAPKSFFSTTTRTDPRRTLGIAPYHNTNFDPLGNPITPHTEGEFAGSLFVEIDGAQGNHGLVNTKVIGGSTYNTELLLSTAGTVGGAPVDFRIRVVPEPTALALLGLSTVAIIWSPRHRIRIHFRPAANLR